MQFLIELPKEFEEHFDFGKFQDSFMRIGGGINKIRKSHSQLGAVSLVLSGKYEHGLVDILKNAFLNAKKGERKHLPNPHHFDAGVSSLGKQDSHILHSVSRRRRVNA